MKTYNIFYPMIALGGALFLSAGCSQPTTQEDSSELIEEIEHPISDDWLQLDSDSVLKAGRALYEEACMACHGRNLEGATGFNLVDYEWVHGEDPNAILQNIKAGFIEKGMPPFEGVYSDEKLQELVTYIVSQRAGWTSLNYEIRQLEDFVPEDFDYATLSDFEVVKSGEFHNRLGNFGIAEMPFYAMTIEGELNVPYGKPTVLYARGRRSLRLRMEIDGQEGVFGKWKKGRYYEIEPGKHNVRLTYASLENGFHNGKNLPIMLADPSLEFFHVGLTTQGDAIVNKSSYEVTTEDGPVMSMRRIKGVNGSAISVGLPSALNYAYDSKTCEVTSVWTGDFLDIGPNITGNANNPARILGNWVFNAPQTISISAVDGKGGCKHQSVSFNPEQDDVPKFEFLIDGETLELVGSEEGDRLKLAYQFDARTEKSFTFQLPDELLGHIESEDGSVLPQTVNYSPTAEDNSIAFFVRPVPIESDLNQ